MEQIRSLPATLPYILFSFRGFNPWPVLRAGAAAMSSLPYKRAPPRADVPHSVGLCCFLDSRAGNAKFGAMRVVLTAEQQDFVRRAVESGRFERAEDAIQEAVSLWIEHERRRTEILAVVDAAQASIDRGEGIEITDQSMRELGTDVKRRGRARLAAEHPTTR